MITAMYNSREQWEGSVKAASTPQPTATATLLSEDHLQILNAKTPIFGWPYLQSIYIVFPGVFQVNATWSLRKGLLPKENSQLVWCFFLCYFEALIQVFPGTCPDAYRPLTTSLQAMEFRNHFRPLIQVFHFAGRKWHLPSPSKSQSSQLGQASFSPAPGARKHTDLHLVISNSKEHGQQSTAPTCFKQA